MYLTCCSCLYSPCHILYPIGQQYVLSSWYVYGPLFSHLNHCRHILGISSSLRSYLGCNAHVLGGAVIKVYILEQPNLVGLRDFAGSGVLSDKQRSEEFANTQSKASMYMSFILIKFYSFLFILHLALIVTHQSPTHLPCRLS